MSKLEQLLVLSKKLRDNTKQMECRHNGVQWLVVKEYIPRTRYGGSKLFRILNYYKGQKTPFYLPSLTWREAKIVYAAIRYGSAGIDWSLENVPARITKIIGKKPKYW